MGRGRFYFLKNDKGFTLVELLIVIIILVVLTGIAIPAYAIVNNRAREAACESEMSNIAKSLEIYIAGYNAYPDENNFPDALITSEIMTNFPVNDPWETPYQYTSNNGRSYILESYGINRIDGGNDDIIFINGVMTENGAHLTD